MADLSDGASVLRRSHSGKPHSRAIAPAGLENYAGSYGARARRAVRRAAV